MTYRLVRTTFRLLLCIVGISATALYAQESCYEKYFREHNKEILPTIDENDDSYDELKKEVIARQVLRGETPYAQHIADRYDQPAAKTSAQSHALHRPVILAIDTTTGVCHLLAEDGTVLADAHIALVDSTWYMWLSVDPLADKNPSSNPYMYCNGNPIMLVDPDGRDVWELSDDGTIKARILDKTQDAIAMKGKSISFDYGTIDKGYNGKERNNTKYTYFQFAEGKENEAASAFKFLADNSNVEYALVNTDKGISSVYTNHRKNDVLTEMAAKRVETFFDAKMTDNYHSHTNGTMFPSGLKDGTRDVGFAKRKGDTYGFFIYPTKSNGVIEYFSNGSYNGLLQPWPYKDAGNISPYVRQSGIPALLRKFGIK